MAIIQVFLGLRNILVYGTFPEETWEILDLEANLPYMRALLSAVVFATNEGLFLISYFISHPLNASSHSRGLSGAMLLVGFLKPKSRD